MRKLTDGELDLLVNGANSLASSWKLRALIEEIRKDPGVIAAGKNMAGKICLASLSVPFPNSISSVSP